MKQDGLTHLGFKSGCGVEKRGGNGGPCGGDAVHTPMHSDGGAVCVCVCVCVCVRACMSECIWGVCVCVIKVAASSVKASEEKSTIVNSLGKR